jgi:hypothetical protein
MYTKSINKKVRNVETDKTKLLFDGITFKSKLELYFYKQQKIRGYHFKYEKFKTTLYKGEVLECIVYTPIPKSKFLEKRQYMQEITEKNKSVTYSPDFYEVMKNKDGKDIMVIVETKGLITDSYAIKKKLFLAHISKRYGANVYFFEPHNQRQINQVFDILKTL